MRQDRGMSGPAEQSGGAGRAAPRQSGKPPRRRRSAREGGTERGLRELTGAGHSQLGVSGALRARDVNRPTDDDLAEAEQSTVIVRRNWKPTPPS
jgi:hypothetical protein